VTDDRSLDEFLDATPEDDSDPEDHDGDLDTGERSDAGDAGGEAGSGETTPPGAGDVEEDEPTTGSEGSGAAPAVSTYEWSPDGRDCEECGASVRRRWRDGAALVCQACKGWE